MATETTQTATDLVEEEKNDDISSSEDNRDAEIVESDNDGQEVEEDAEVLQSEKSKSLELTDEQEDDEWGGVLPPPEEAEGDELIPPAPSIEGEDEAEEKTDDDDLYIVGEKKKSEEQKLIQPYKERPPPTVARETEEDVPDFSRYKTNVAERLWRAKNQANKAGVTASPDLVPLAREYQHWRQKMGLLNKYIDEYEAAMQVLSEKRNQLFKQYAHLSEDTPLWDRVGKPLTGEQVSEMQESGDIKTLGGIELRTKSIMKVAEEIGSGSLMAHHQLSAMQEQLNKIDYQNHIVNYIDEWDEVVTSKLDNDVKAVRELAKNRDKYIVKVDKLREKVNKIELKGKKFAPKELNDKLDRNEKKLDECDALYEKKANEVSVVLYEATKRGWVDFYPVIKNVMKFEINRLGRESSTYGSFPRTLNELKKDYKDATKNTADAPNIGSAL